MVVSCVHHVDNDSEICVKHDTRLRIRFDCLSYGAWLMSSAQHQQENSAEDRVVACETTLSLTEDVSRPASFALAAASQPSAVMGLLGMPLGYLRTGTLSAKLLLSGGVAGAVSRTATAPIDRLKFLLQVQDGQLISISQVMSKIREIQYIAPFFFYVS